MIPKSLSASAISVYETCPARYKASYIDRVPDMGGSAASLGTALHEALEHWVKDGHYQHPDKKVLMDLWDVAYHNHFPDRERYEEGKQILGEWFERTDLLDGRKIISTELKKSFDVKTSAGVIPFNYIMDRVDKLPDDSVEVIDYKSSVLPIQPEALKTKIQPRVYAMAAMMEHPDAVSIWVTFDQLRYDTVGLKFNREDNVETWKYLKALAERIIADDGTEERLNPECRFCVRKLDCATLNAHINGGGELRIDDLETAINKRAQLEFAKAAMSAQIQQLDEYLLTCAEEQNVTEFKTDLISMSISAKARRDIDSQRAAKILGPEIMAEHGVLQMKHIDAILKDKDIPADKRAQLKALIGRKFGSPTITTKPLHPLSDD